MIERMLENWLDKANERTFQAPFCHSLAFEGHTVVHMSRHCAMEMGKDILSIAPDGVPCAFQLKGIGGGKLTLARWRDELSKQVYPLVMGKIIHPSIDSSKPHRSYIVLNGELDEEVSREIDDFNGMRESEGLPERRIHVIVKGELLNRFKILQTDFWPVDLIDTKTLLELYLESGRDRLPKEKLASLFESTLPFKTENGAKPSNGKCSRAIASCALLCSMAISSYSNSDNYSAEFEAWTVYFSYVLALAERWHLPEKAWQVEINVASKSMFNALGRLCDELMQRSDLVEGDGLTDSVVYAIRLTYLVGTMSIYALWRIASKEDETDHDRFLREFCQKYTNKLYLWGEYGVPQFISFYLYFRKINATKAPALLLYEIIRTILMLNGPKGQQWLANVYYDVDEILPYMINISDKPLDISFKGTSYTLESLVHLFVRTNWKTSMKMIWPEITKIAPASFEPENSWDYYFWRSNRGTNRTKLIQATQKWDDLKMLAFECKGNDIPPLIKNYPIEYLCFLVVFPHRLNSSGIRWIDTRLNDL